MLQDTYAEWKKANADKAKMLETFQVRITIIVVALVVMSYLSAHSLAVQCLMLIYHVALPGQEGAVG